MKEWNGWELHNTHWLSFGAYLSGDYDIDLRRCTSAAQMLDFIMQIAGKTWANDECLAGLVRALDDILHPQAHLCSSGVPRKLSVKTINELCRHCLRRPTLGKSS